MPISTQNNPTSFQIRPPIVDMQTRVQAGDKRTERIKATVNDIGLAIDLWEDSNQLTFSSSVTSV